MKCPECDEDEVFLRLTVHVLTSQPASAWVEEDGTVNKESWERTDVQIKDITSQPQRHTAELECNTCVATFTADIDYDEEGWPVRVTNLQKILGIR